MSDSSDQSTALLAPPENVELGVVELTVLEGPDRGARQRVGPGRVRIGSARGCQVQLTDPTVSRLHTELDIGRDGFRVKDLDSTNGTFIEGIRVVEVWLNAATLLRVGSSLLRVESANERAFLPLSRATSFGRMLGASTAMRRVYAILERAALTDSTVLLQGETGTGKEVAALSVHEASDQADGPFVAIDCGAIAENLIESELFGHARGAFSGAIQERVGLLEQAHGGTLFLDEIGELPVALQPKLLRALETREVRRVGSNKSRQVDVRVVAATNRDLARSVNEGLFREDLYYRLAVIDVILPPLRTRAEDIPLLARHFFASFSGKDEVPQELLASLMRRTWPGNVRELRNFIERSVALGWVDDHTHRGATAEASAPGLEALVPADQPLKRARELWNARFEVLYASAVLRQAHGNVTRAAELAGVTRRSLQRLMAQHGLRSGRTEDDDAEDE